MDREHFSVRWFSRACALLEVLCDRYARLIQRRLLLVLLRFDSCSGLCDQFDRNKCAISIKHSGSYSQKLALWQLCDDEQPILQDRISVDLGDVNCLAVSSLDPGSDLLVAAGGMGIENIFVRTSDLPLLDKP